MNEFDKEQQPSKNLPKVECPHCGYKMPITYEKNAVSRGVFVRCKGRCCGRVFEIIVETK